MTLHDELVRMYDESDDPWDFETSWYERRMSAITLASLPRRRYRSAYEPGCSIGVLTGCLRTVCDALLGSEIRAAGDRRSDAARRGPSARADRAAGDSCRVAGRPVRSGRPLRADLLPAARRAIRARTTCPPVTRKGRNSHLGRLARPDRALGGSSRGGPRDPPWTRRPRVDRSASRARLPARSLPAMIEAVTVVVPAHDERQLLPGCIRSLRRAADHPALIGISVRIAVVLDRCSDTSGDRVAPLLRASDLLLERRDGNVGAARRAGLEALLNAEAGRAPSSIWLATTDADSRVPADWLARQLRLADAGADAIAGIVDIDDWGQHPKGARLAFEASYAAATNGFVHRHVRRANLGLPRLNLRPRRRPCRRCSRRGQRVRRGP